MSSPLSLTDLCPPRFSLCPSKSFGQVSYVMFRITRIRIRFRITPQVSSHDSPAEPFQSFYSHIRCLQLQRFILCKTNQIVFQLRLKSSFQFSTRSGFFVSQFGKSPHFPFSRSNIRFPPVFAAVLMTASCVHWQQFFEPSRLHMITFARSSHLSQHYWCFLCHISHTLTQFLIDSEKRETRAKPPSQNHLRQTCTGGLARGRLMLRDTTKICRHLRLPEECLMKIQRLKTYGGYSQND